MNSQILITVGLGLDILGVCILFRFGLPGAVRRTIRFARNIDIVGSAKDLTPEEREEDRIQMEREHRWDVGSGIGQWSALVFLVLGFVLQIVGVWV